ncbi:MSHA biogenesis protein MshN [Marinobacter sp. M216]|uniref:MSHA biogenesis protein MshN n=1 Tax=Marinobacter albus TaxID=3030833 RepID=A0ABT7HGU8_9GAMM|nr:MULTISPECIES: MSHA biogenesis protein MshN [unclassified Marinobacter]MBW7472994.1 MSHA biogenesis protein MshN [Marinobacter sp. F4218]MDK9559613.1 MSHA biogenesis protein MshN [Marinobacter sp. M216]
MSLLNDALRAAEQRQKRPDVAAAYTGQSFVPRKQRRWLLPVSVVLTALVVATAVYEYSFRDQSIESDVAGSASRSAVKSNPEPAEAAIQAPPTPPKTAADNARPASEAENTTVQVEQPSAPEEVRKVTETTAVEPSPGEVAETPEVADRKLQLTVDAPATEESEPRPAASQPPVKQVRETPEAVDLRVSRELSSLLRTGDSRAAEQRLTDIASRQDAPVSREVFARAMLVQDMPERALRWLSDAEVQEYPALRLLEARALLALGKLEAALATLLRDVPSVREYTEYRVTLATLLQQSGQAVEAARHWSALISVDDSRPAWWVGLAIALESRGEVSGALKAYFQAARLPGLSPSLTDYVRDRLKTLQAG